MIKVNEIPIITEKFPNNETKVKDFAQQINSDKTLQVDYLYKNDDELLSLLFVKGRLDELNQQSTLEASNLPSRRLSFIKNLRFSKASLKFQEIEDVERPFGTSIQLQEQGNGEVLLKFKYSTDKDLVELASTKQRLDELNKKVNLFVWYMPYSRMDREIPGDLFTLKYVTDFISKLNFNKVSVMEPHSSKTVDLFKKHGVKIKDIYPTKDWLHEVMAKQKFTSLDHVVFPDKGARERYSDIDVPNVLTFDKKRNPETGKIEGIELKEGQVNEKRQCIIIDDLCSKGGTFMGVGGSLKQRGVGEVNLLVAHCEDAIFDGAILKQDSPINKVYTSESILTKAHPNIKILSLNKVSEGIHEKE